MIFVKTNEGNYYTLSDCSSITHIVNDHDVTVWLNGFVVATCATLEEAQKVKDEIVRLAVIADGNAIISIKTTDGGTTTVVIDDL